MPEVACPALQPGVFVQSCFAAMTAKQTILTLLSAVVFVSAMSVSFLVEARDVPHGAQPVITPVMEFVGPPVPVALPVSLEDVEDGVASWYGPGFHGRRTASGRRFNMDELTAAHPRLPFGSLVVVDSERTGRRIIVELTDRGPYIKPRVIDLSRAAARSLGIGVGRVDLQALRPDALKAFYGGNDSTVVGITESFYIKAIPVAPLAHVKHHNTDSAAVRARDCDEVIVVALDSKDRPAFSTGRPKALAFAPAVTTPALASADVAGSTK